MKTNQDNDKEQNLSVGNETTTPTSTPETEFVDNSPEAIEMRSYQKKVDNRPEAIQMQEYQDKINGVKKKNTTGIPDNIKDGIEKLSGISLDDVTVHYNSPKPAEIGANAYAKGTDVYIAPGQEEHLPQELWHVIQQKQGKVKAKIKAHGENINNEDTLEEDAKGIEEKIGKNQNGEEVELETIENKGQGVVQRDETLSENIVRILLQRGIYISDEEADEYAKLLDDAPANTEIQIFNRHRALKLNAAGRLSSVKRRPPSGAHHMRADPKFGPMEEENISMISEGRFPTVGNIVENAISIKGSDLAKIDPRDNLRSVMGGSAAEMSQIAHSEWLHCIAHSLGGEDKHYNLAAGPHALNTAMIPFELAVKKLVFAGKVVDYNVVFFTNQLEGGLTYVTGVEIGIAINNSEAKYWTLGVNESRVSEFINGGVLAEIEGIAGELVDTHMS